jgi:hypothetical protein
MHWLLSSAQLTFVFEPRMIAWHSCHLILGPPVTVEQKATVILQANVTTLDAPTGHEGCSSVDIFTSLPRLQAT